MTFPGESVDTRDSVLFGICAGFMIGQQVAGKACPYRLFHPRLNRAVKRPPGSTDGAARRGDERDCNGVLVQRLHMAD
jgi:hypothetical protein